MYPRLASMRGVVYCMYVYLVMQDIGCYGFQCFCCSSQDFEPSDITVAMSRIMAAVGHLDEFYIRKKDLTVM